MCRALALRRGRSVRGPAGLWGKDGGGSLDVENTVYRINITFSAEDIYISGWDQISDVCDGPACVFKTTISLDMLYKKDTLSC